MAVTVEPPPVDNPHRGPPLSTEQVPATDVALQQRFDSKYMQAIMLSMLC